MRVYYLDAGALVKRYHEEPGSLFVATLLEANHIVASSSLAPVETVAALARKRKAKEITRRGLARKLRELDEDWEGFVEIRPAREVLEHARSFARTRALRAADAIHLASAVRLKGRLAQGDLLTIVASDEELIAAANQERLEVIDLSTR
jgi:hypothetical protein